MKQDDLFDNPMIRNVMKQLPAKDLENYKNIGEKLYANIDKISGSECKSENKETIPDTVRESLAYIIEGLKSGLLISDLEESEVRLLVEYADVIASELELPHLSDEINKNKLKQ